MKKYLLTASAAALLGIAVLALHAAGGTSAECTVFSSAGNAEAAMGGNDVQIEVLQSRVCRDTRRHGENCYVQEIIGRVVATGKQAGNLHAGDCVGLRGRITPCGTCSECKASRPDACLNSGLVCPENCRLHAGACRNRIVTAGDNVVKVSATEKAEQIFPRLCTGTHRCPVFRCRDSANDASLPGGVRHCRGRRHGGHCR